MKRRIAALSILTTVTLTALAAPVSASDKTYNLNFSSHNATGTVGNLAVEKFVELVNEKSDGRITVTFFQDGTLANELDAIQMVKTGELEFAIACDNFSTQLANGYDPCIIPFVFQNADDASAVYDEENLGTYINDAIKENGNAYLIGIQKRTPRLLTAKEAIETPDQLKGINIRVPQIDYWVSVWNGLGAVSTVVDWNETYQALQTGVVDCQENPIDNIYANKIYEVNKYVMNTEHQYGVNHWIANIDFMDSLDEEDRAIIQEAADEATAYGDELLEEKSAEYFDELNEQGLINFVEVDKQAWSSAAKETIDSILAASFDPAVQEYVNNYMGAQ